MNNGDPINVCIAVSKYPPRFGGHGIQMQRTIPFLNEMGVHSTILTSRCQDQPRLSRGQHGENVARVLTPGRSPIARLLRIRQIRRHFHDDASRYDLFHCANLDWEALLVLPYLKRSGLSLIHEMVLLDGDDPLTVSRERFGRFKLKLLKHFDAFVGISRTFLPRLQMAGIPEERFRLIHTGVDIELYRPASLQERQALRTKLGLPLAARIVVTVGSIIPRKGMDRLIRAWARVRPVKGNDLLLLVGPRRASEGLSSSDAGHAAELLHRARQSDIGGTVEFLGTRGNVQDYMRCADLFCFLSRKEGLGTVTLEAMSCGLPCILSPLDGIAAELVVEGATGFIVHDPDDADCVGALIARVLADRALRIRLGEEGRCIAAQRFSFETRAAALADLYGEVTERQGH